MNDIISKYFTELSDITIIISALFAIFYYKKYKHTVVRYFIYYMIYVAFVDVFGGYTWYIYRYESLNFIRDALKGTLIERNFWWYNIFWVLGSAVFLSAYFSKLLKSTLYKKVVTGLCGLVILTFIFRIIVDVDSLFQSIMSVNLVFGSLVIVTCIVFYFIEILQSDKILNFLYSFNSIASSTMFIWFLIITPITFYDLYFNSADWNFVFLRHHIYFFSNLFMYGMFSLALVWCNPNFDLESNID